MFSFLDSILNPNKVEIDKIKKIVATINTLEDWAKGLKDDEFKPEIAQIKEE